MKKIIFIAAITAQFSYGFTQLQNANWVFGDSIGLNFSDGLITPFNSNLPCYQASASLSDADGQLLFYTNGQSVFNKNHELMLNGDGLHIAATNNPEYPYSQYPRPLIIIPKPDHLNKYFIIHSVGSYDSVGLVYSEIDLNKEGGLGEVISKNNHLLICFDYTSDDCTGPNSWVTAVRHGNGRDWWMISFSYNSIPSYFDSTEFIISLISPDGIQEPTFQLELPDYEINLLYYGSSYLVAVSPTGDIFAFPSENKVDFYLFDRCSGLFSYSYSLDLDNLKTSDAVFSPDGNKIYVIAGGNTNTSQRIFQFCFNCGIDVQETKTEIYKNTYGAYVLNTLQLAIDGKIYFGHEYGYYSPVYEKTYVNTHLSVINNPNLEGLECNVDTLTIDLDDKIFTGGFPNIINYDLGVLPKSACDTLGTSVSSVQHQTGFTILPNPVQNIFYVQTNTSAFYNVQLINVQGKKMLNIPKYTTGTPVEVSHLPAGVYAVLLTDESGITRQQKLMISR